MRIRALAAIAGALCFAPKAVQAENDIDDDDIGDELPEAFSAGESEVDDVGGGYDEVGPGGADKLFQLGLRTGFGFPLGEATDGGDLSDGAVGQIPIWLDLVFKVTPNVHAGVYGMYGFVIPETADATSGAGCPDIDGVDCSAYSIRFGAQVAYHFAPFDSPDPWLGAGIGYELAAATASDGDVDTSSKFRGPEFLNLQAGIDFGAPDGFPIGPFVSHSFGQYTNFSVESPALDTSGEIPNKATHNWLVLGIRGGVDL